MAPRRRPYLAFVREMSGRCPGTVAFAGHSWPTVAPPIWPVTCSYGVLAQVGEVAE